MNEDKFELHNVMISIFSEVLQYNISNGNILEAAESVLVSPALS